MKAQSWQWDPAQYDLRFSSEPLYAQLDGERHVNNVAVLGFYTETRLRLQMAALGEGSWYADTLLLRPCRTVTQFIGQVHYPGEITCAARLVALERDTYRLALVLFQYGQCVGVQECLMGAWQGDCWVALPEPVAESLKAWLNVPPSLMPWPEILNAEPASWPCHSRLVGRYADLDPDRVLGELALARYMEQSRARPLGLIRPPSLGMMVARLDMRFWRWDQGVGEVELPSGISRIDNKSFRVAGRVAVDGDSVAGSESVSVLTDRKTGATMPLVGGLLEQMQQIAIDSTRIEESAVGRSGRGDGRG